MNQTATQREVEQIADVGGNSNVTQVMCLCALLLAQVIEAGFDRVANAIEENA